jgi:uncharacterized protein YjbI with pentapeptide repeats
MNVPLRKFSDELRDKIKLYSKKHIDIKDLINGYDISNENLSYSHISELNLSERDISNCNFSHSTIKLIVNNGVARNCNFSYVTFLTSSSFRATDLRNSNFDGCNATNIDFAYSNLRDITYCNATFTMFSKYFYKAKFSKKFLELMHKFLDIEGLSEII